MDVEVVSRQTGEVLLTTRDGEQYGLLFDLRAIERVETQMKASISDLFIRWGGNVTRHEDGSVEIDASRPGKPGVNDLKMLVMTGNEGWHRRANGNGANHQRITPNNVLDVMERLGKFTPLMSAVLGSLSLAWNEDEDEDEGEVAGDADPPGRGPAH